MTSEAPTTIGRFVVERRLGAGGMGEVFLAHSPAGDPVAVKVIRSDRLDPVTRQRFEKEALVARTVVGTNRVARFLDADPYAERPWLAMEYVPGQTLAAYIEEHGPLPAALVASLGALLSEGLQAVHVAGLLHRDLKPQNVVLGEYGPVLIDFGLAALLDPGADTLAQSGMIIGTARTMPPEQASGTRRGTEAADVYGLGAVLLFAATGHCPYEGDHWQAILAQVVNPDVQPDLTGLPDVLRPVVEPMLAHGFDTRPSLNAVMAACTDVLSDEGTTPIAARQALVARTAPDRSDVPPPPALGTDQPDADSVPSALDGLPPADGEATDPVPDARQSDEAGDPVPEPTGRGHRRPASERIAEELRARYAAQVAL